MAATLIDDHLRFRLDDVDPAVTAVVLQCERAVPGPREFTRDDAGWCLDLPVPSLQRIEYRFAVGRGDAVDVVLDPANPLTVGTAFGDRSVVELPGYAPPWWQTCIGLPDDWQKTLVGRDGELLYDYPGSVAGFAAIPGFRARVACGVASETRWVRQELVDPRVPIVRTLQRAGEVDVIQ